jgi:DNA-binding transcriptional regulator YhcF (GntR family)
MMRFNNDKPIFVQIADLLEDEIVAGRFAEGARLPSSRELASSLEVNPNTAARALQILADRSIAEAARGTGYSVAPEALVRSRLRRRNQFFNEVLPGLFKAMAELDIGMEEISAHFKKWVINAKDHI